MEQKYVEILKSYADHDMNAVQTGKIVYIHSKGRFVTVTTKTPGGDVTETFRPGEVQAV